MAAKTAEEVANVLKSGRRDRAANVTMDPIEAIGDRLPRDLHPEVSTSVKVVLQKSKITIS